MKTSIVVECDIEETPRVEQVRGLFDLAPEKTSKQFWTVELPIEERPWNIGLIQGPSGCGKTTIARNVWTRRNSIWLEDTPPWSSRLAVVDGFPEESPIKEVCEILSSVGFSSPPAWLKPYHVLSTGQKFRCDLAKLLSIEQDTVRVFDEFTSVVDRTVAQIGSAAVSKVIRAKKQQFVTISCHDDVIEWLQPDWVYNPAEGSFLWRSLRRRPRIQLDVTRTTAATWRLFAPHHYLTGVLNPASTCFLATWRDRPVAFSSWLAFMGNGPVARREHRTVCLPDFQGVGIGNCLSDTIASMWAGLGYLARSTTTHPAMMRSRLKSKNWVMIREPGLGSSKIEGKQWKRATTRMTAGFLYQGKAMPHRQAEMLRGQ